MQIRMKENKNDILCRIIVYELQQKKRLEIYTATRQKKNIRITHSVI